MDTEELQKDLRQGRVGGVIGKIVSGKQTLYVKEGGDWRLAERQAWQSRPDAEGFCLGVVLGWRLRESGERFGKCKHQGSRVAHRQG